MKYKWLVTLLGFSILSQNVFVYADNNEVIQNSEFSPDFTFSQYPKYESLGLDMFSVSNTESINNKALFYKDVQITDFIFNSISNKSDEYIVSQIIDGIEIYGLLSYDKYNNSEPNYIFPIKYKSITFQYINHFDVWIIENFDGNIEYYISKDTYNIQKERYLNETFNIEYEDYGKYIKLKSIDDIPNPYLKLPRKQIKGSDMYVVENSYIVDKNGNLLTNNIYGKIDEGISPGNTLVVWVEDESMRGWTESICVLNQDLEKIVEPFKGYNQILFYESDGNIYIKATNDSEPSSKYYKLDYYDLEGNIVEEPKNLKALIGYNTSSWAKESIQEAINLGIVPQEIQERYTAKISRNEFAKLAVQAYSKKTGYKVDMNAKSPFEDNFDPYVTAAYNLKIVSGTSKTTFSGGNTITRQEAAVMMNNLVKLLNIKSTPQKQKFVDEKYFAPWAKNAIYSIAGIKSGDTYVMAGTGEGKFSPWYNYTIEQAITSMLRLYKCV